VARDQVSTEFRRSLPALIGGFTVCITFLAVLGIMLRATGPDGLGLTPQRTSGWIAAVYGLPMIPALILSLRFRMPLPFTGNVFAIIFFASLGHRVSFSELAGATILAGVLVLLTGILGVTGQLARWIPLPIVQGLIAGAVMPFVIDLFTSLSTGAGWELPAVIAAALVAYLASQRFLGMRLPPILPAFLAGAVVALLTGQLGAFPTSFAAPGLEPIVPRFSWEAILTVTPVLVALMTVQANIPSTVYLRSQGFEPPGRTIDVVSGVGTALGSLLGPVALSLALPPLLVTAGASAGDRSLRYRSIYPVVLAGLLIAAFAGTAAQLSMLLPPALLLAVAGLALLPALGAALQAIATGPLVLGPLLAFAIALSDMTVAGLDSFFWSLVIGVAVSLFLERDGWRELRDGVAAPLPDPS
jgi:benzoate membrane transport protein